MAISEIALIVFVALMLFGAKNIPEIARTLGKGMAQIKNATNEIKSEITKSADLKEFEEIKNIAKFDNNPTEEITKEIDKFKEDIEDITGPIKRQH
jgi:sec-independent protein translocase protein TatA